MSLHTNGPLMGKYLLGPLTGHRYVLLATNSRNYVGFNRPKRPPKTKKIAPYDNTHPLEGPKRARWNPIFGA